MKELLVNMPAMGEGVHEAQIVKWLVNEGELIEEGEPILEVSTDKVDTEVPSPVSGKLLKKELQVGEMAVVGKPIAVVEFSGSIGGDNDVDELFGLAGDSDLNAMVEDDVADTGKVKTSNVKITPLARKIAAINGINLNDYSFEGKDRVVKKDVEDLIASKGNSAFNGKQESIQNTNKSDIKVSVQADKPYVPKEVFATKEVSMPSGSGATLSGSSLEEAGKIVREPMSQLRMKIAENMVASKRISPHVTTVIEVDMHNVWEFKKRNEERFLKEYGFKLSFTPFFIMAALEGIKKVPVVNSSVDGTDILYKKFVNFGVAVALDSGVIVPTIKDANKLNFIAIAESVNDLAARARSKKLKLEEIQGGTFSFTNFGIFGATFGQPIISQPQVAIMGAGAIIKRPVVINDAIAIRPMCNIVLSFDHRIIDGLESGLFLKTVKDYLEGFEAF